MQIAPCIFPVHTKLVQGCMMQAEVDAKVPGAPMMAAILVAIVLLLTAKASQAAPAGDEVTAFPGWDKPLPSRHYSGCTYHRP